MTTQNQDDLESLHETHSLLCSKVAELGPVVPEELLADFDTPEQGQAIVASLEKIVADAVAAVPNGEQGAKAKSKNKSSTKKAKEVKQQEKSKMSKTAKKTASVTKKATVKKSAKKAVTKRGTGKVAQVITMLRRKGGATRGQILKAIGWRAISVQQVAAGQGVKLKIDTSKRPFHYMAA